MSNRLLRPAACVFLLVVWVMAACSPGGAKEAYSPRALGARVVQVVKQFAAGRSQHDDIALVGFGRTG
jgi:hypothetical protein